jgi:large subunit ribosomal protein L4
MVVTESNKNIYLSSRNLQGAKVVNASDVNTYDLVNASKVVLSEGALEIIESILS